MFRGRLRGVLGVFASASIAVLLSGTGCRPDATPVAPPKDDGRGTVLSEPARLPPLGEARGVLIRSDGASPVFLADLHAGDFLSVEVSQGEVDVAIELTSPDPDIGGLLVDTPTGMESPERLWVVAELDGEYRLAVRPVGDQSGRCSLRLVDGPRPARPDDRLRFSALRSFLRAESRRSLPGHGASDYDEALQAWQALGNPPESMVAWRRAIRALVQESAVRRAAEHCDSVTHAFDLDASTRETVRLNYECGNAYRFNSDSEKAFELFDRARRIAEALDYRHGLASALHGLALWHKDRGELDQSLELARKSLQIFDELGYPGSAASALYLIGTLLILLNHPETALDYLQQAMDIRLERGEDSAAALTKIALALSLVAEKDRAIEKLEQAVQIRKRVGNLRGEAITLDQLGSLYREVAEPQKALGAYQRALSIFERFGDQGSTVNTRSNLGWLYLTMGRLDPAHENFEIALAGLAKSADRNAEAHVHAGLAQVARLNGDLEAARSHLEKALEIVEAQRSSVPGQGLRASYFATWQAYYDFYVDLLMDLHRGGGRDFAALAFHAAERARARSFLDLLASSPPKLPMELPPELRRQEQALRARLVEAELRWLTLGEATPTPQRESAERDLRRLLLEFEFLLEDMRANGSNQEQPSDPPRPLELSEVQTLLDEETLLLSYHLGRERSFLWLVDARSMEVFELPDRELIEMHAASLHRLLPASHHLRARRQVRLVAESLSEILLGPVGPRLASKRLLIVGDGKLNYVPFSALPLPRTAAPTADLGSELPYLVVGHEIVHLPSASALAQLRERRARQAPFLRDLALVGDPVFASVGPGASPGLPRLASARQEAESILELVPGDRRLGLLGLDANKERVINGNLGRSRYLHFATHSLLHDDLPWLSVIVLSQVDEHGNLRDGLLHLYEVLTLHLQVDLVVLSACETALGSLVRGEGIVGMSQGFLSAGASRVVVSLWKIEDEATAQFMTELYRGLLERRQSPAAALRSAQLAMLEHPRWRAPSYWAAFELQGDWL